MTADNGVNLVGGGQPVGGGPNNVKMMGTKIEDQHFFALLRTTTESFARQDEDGTQWKCKKVTVVLLSTQAENVIPRSMFLRSLWKKRNGPRAASGSMAQLENTSRITRQQVMSARSEEFVRKAW